MNFGICMQGVEEHFERALRERAKPGQPFTYVEIGTANCGTFGAVIDILRDTKANWRAIGIDPSPEALESFNKLMGSQPAPVHHVYLTHTRFINATREEAFRDHSSAIGPAIHFAFIDGCHSERCATGDFLAVEPLIARGGLAVFHDIAGSAGIQPHCQVDIGVVEALKNLGLFHGTRPGWKRLPNWETDISTNNYPCGVFEKV